jgi:ParB family transcriptional regulator, chromosome partitioning protein
MTIATIEVTRIPLNKLSEDATNVRRVGREQNIEELAALIEAHGLLNPLSVRAILKDGQPTGRYGVIAGGRRHRALQMLAAQRRIAKNAPVACCIVSDEDATEISLTENSGRLVMHPADQFDAFSKLHAGGTGQTVEQIAQRFGIPTQTVRQRLRLASVSPSLMERFRAGSLTLDHMMAFAVTDDHEAQERVAETPEYHLSPTFIRSRLTQGEVPTSDRRARFVTVEAYEAAGGAVRRDLFSDQGGWLMDPQLLDRLVQEALTERAEAVRAEGWGWVDVLPQSPGSLWGTPRVWPQEQALTDVINAEIDALQQRMETIQAEAGDDDLTAEQDAELERIEAQIETLQSRALVFSDADKARSGALVFLGSSGPQVERGILREANAQAQQQEQEGEGQAPRATAEAQADKAPAMSAALAAELAAHRTAGLQAEVAFRPHLALCLLIQALACPYDSALGVRISEPALAAACPGIEDTEARKRVDPEAQPFRDHAPSGRDMLTWLLEQDTETLVAILAPMVARGLDAGSADWTQARDVSPAMQAAQLAGLDMRHWWTADAQSYLSRIPKALILEAVRAGVDGAAASDLSGMKKEAMANAAARRLAGKGWLPSLLRTPADATQTEPETDQMAEAAD